MGSKARARVQGSAEARRRRARVVAVSITAAAVLVVGIVAVALATRANQPAPAASSAEPPQGKPAAVPSPVASGAAAPTAATAGSLDAAADAVGFHVTTASNVGLVENMPADTVLMAPSATLLPVGTRAPDFTLSTPEGTRVRLSDYRGKVVLLEFFATWCPHCQAEAPHLLALYDRLPRDTFAFLSVNGDSEDAASVHAFRRHFGLPWPELLDPGLPPGSFAQQGGIGPVSRSWGLSLFPTFYIIDRAGLVAWRNDREQPDGLLLQKLRDAAAQ